MWLTCVVYDSAGNYRYNTYISGSEPGTLYVDGYDGAVIRLSIERHSDEFDLSSIKLVKTDRIWSAQKYSCNTSTGKIAIKGQDCITLHKIPVEGGTTYKLSTTGSHQWLKWLEYAEDGTYLGVKGDKEAPKEVEAIVSRYATHVVLCVYGGETNVDDYVTFVKTADVPVVQTGLVYELAEPVTLNGTSDYIDTGVKLYDYDKDFEIMLEFEEISKVGNWSALLHCMNEASPWQGLTIKHDPEHIPFIVNAIGVNNVQGSMSYNGVTRMAIAKIGGYYCLKVMYEGITEPQLVIDSTAGYVKVDNTLLLGAYQDNSGVKGRFWNGTISKCKVYFDELPSAEETDAFLMGEDVDEV